MPCNSTVPRSSGSKSTESPTSTLRTLGPTATTLAQLSRRPTCAVAGMTMPPLERRSPSSPPSRTSTRSCRSFIGTDPSSAGRVSGIDGVVLCCSWVEVNDDAARST